MLKQVDGNNKSYTLTDEFIEEGEIYSYYVKVSLKSSQNNLIGKSNVVRVILLQEKDATL